MVQPKSRHNTIFYKWVKKAAALELDHTSSHTAKKTMWLKMGLYLEKETDLDNHKISTEILRHIQQDVRESLTVEERMGKHITINTAHYYRVMNQHGWIDRTRGRPINTEPLPAGSKFTKPNLQVRDVLAETRRILQIVEGALTRTGADGKAPQELAKLLGQKAVDDFCRGLVGQGTALLSLAANNKKVPTNGQHMFMDLFRLQSLLSDACILFAEARLRLVKEYKINLTKGHALAIMKKRVHPLPYIYRPKDRDAALFYGWTGGQCINCKSWCVQEIAQGLECWDCKTQMPHQTRLACPDCWTPFYTDLIPKIRKSGHCPHCEAVIILPASAEEISPPF